ncbi:class I SAM-dependent methyltransferase [Rhizorhapis sp. SPR117]|uniref:class I SAM-dependent methyltransferase n=1 Tax=Rhizorhapis sp. SPR117 TaxID=2912611 RepID=UPI001F1D760B|nr:class I SAM-dependent methyltransferase [Rhizorhapis sp. SPR117]
MYPNSAADRIQREKDYHDDRFSDETRTSQHKYYFAVSNAFDHYKDMVNEYSQNSDILEYGCSFGNNCIALADNAKSVTGIDISDVAISKARENAVNGKKTNCKFFTMNAEHMTFSDESFDLVFGSGIIHHLNIESAVREVLRVLKPGGNFLFIEPLGGNPVFNIYRALTPRSRTVDEMPLRSNHLSYIQQQTAACEIRYYGFTSLLSVPVQRFGISNLLRKILVEIDQLLFRIRIFQNMAWFSIIKGSKGE